MGEHKHTLKHTHTLSLSSHSLSFSLSLCLSLSLFLSLSFSLSLSLSLSHTHTRSLSLTHTRTHTYTKAIHANSHQQERLGLISEVNKARAEVVRKEEAVQAAKDAYTPMVFKKLEGLKEVENPLEMANKSFQWVSAQACAMARVETPEDVKHRKLSEEKVALEKAQVAKQATPRDSALLRSAKAPMASMPGHAKFDGNNAPNGKGFMPPGGFSIDAKTGEVPKELNGWARINFKNGDYEGEFEDGKPNGYGRTHWDEFRMAYHGEMVNQLMNGEGTFFFANGDMLEGTFEQHKPKGPGVLTQLKTGKRFNVEYDGTKKLSEGAEPTVKTYIDDPMRLCVEHRVTITACSRGDKHEAFVGNYSHCKKSIDGKLAFCVPFRAHRPLENADQIRGKIAVVQRGTCSYGKKLRFVQEAGAIGMVVIGTDNLEKYQQVFQIHEGDPLADDPWPEGQVCIHVLIYIHIYI